MKSLRDYIIESDDDSEGKGEITKTTKRGDIKFTIWKSPEEKLKWLDDNESYQKIEYKLEDKDDHLSIDFLLGFQEDSWKYGYYMINKNDEKYYFYLVHTSSPVTDFDFQKRNQQLITIKKDYYTQHEQSRDKDSKIIMLGDFNVSPWSIFYKRFAQSFPLFENITRSKAVFFSWN